MKKEIYTPTEAYLIEALKTKEQMAEAAQLDYLLLKAEEKLGLLDGLPLEAWLL